MENEAEKDTGASSPLNVEFSFVPYINLAFMLNGIPVIQKLELTNNGGCDLEHLQCVFSCQPDVVMAKTVAVPALKQGKTLALKDEDLQLNYTILSTISEMLPARLKLSVLDGEKALFEKEYPLQAFAADQWLGTGCMPELLASFVTPNLEVVSQLQTVIAQELKALTGSSAIDGYQGGKDRAHSLCAAIFRGIHSWGIHYANPASSFGTPGQKIRFADTIYQYRLGTCLDTTVLFASVMEQCGLHPVVMLQKGHAYIGCHLVERYFPEVPMTDLQVIRKLVDLDEFMVVETTQVTGNVTFEVAEAMARSEHLNIDGDFECAIDIVRARYSGIRPLPLSRSVNGFEFKPEERKVDKLDKEHGRKLQEEVDLSTLKAAERTGDRVSHWAQKLLDLSLRNRLLNVRDGLQVIPIACTDIGLLEDKIAANVELSVNPLCNALDEKDIHDLTMLRNCTVTSNVAMFLEKELGQKRLWTPLEPTDMVRRMKSLYRQCRNDLEEGGVNTLFLALGFLAWKEDERESSKAHLAPILLIPVRLQRKSMGEGIRLTRLDEDTIVNETLLELLRSQKHLSIPGLSPLPTDGSGVDVPLVMQIFRQSVKEMKGWEVREEACVGNFSFGKYVMWNDMTARLAQLQANPLVSHLISGGGMYSDGVEVFPPEEVGEHLDASSLFCPMSADSSQLAAVLYSGMGKSFVLHGPPGTGKSQTITNIIAHNLALGRRVLFVSEKKAALEVVQRRLTSVGLKPFCLELHSSKAGKAEVYKQFQEALDVAECPDYSRAWAATVQALNQSREELDGYVNELHRQFPNGLSAYDCFSRLLDRDGMDMPAVKLDVDCLMQSKSDYEKARRLVEELSHENLKLNAECDDAFQLLGSQEWTPLLEHEVAVAAKALVAAYDALAKQRDDICGKLALPPADKVSTLYALVSLLDKMMRAGDVPAGFLTADSQENLAFLLSFAEDLKTRKTLEEDLKGYHAEMFGELDFDGLGNRIRQIEGMNFISRFFKERSLLSEMGRLKKMGGGRLTLVELKRLLRDGALYLVVGQRLLTGESRVRGILGSQWKGEATAWDSLSGVCRQAEEIFTAVDALCDGDKALKESSLETLRRILPDGAQAFRDGAPLHEDVTRMILAWNDYQGALDGFGAIAPLIREVDSLPEAVSAVKVVGEHVSELREVLRYRSLRRQALEAGIDEFAEAMENGGIPVEGAVEQFDAVVCQTMLNQVLAVSPQLRVFSGDSHDACIARFRQKDAEYMELTRHVIFAKLAARLPRRRSGPCPEGTELGTLKRECGKSTRQMPVRQLLEKVPTLVESMKPCFLMSPMSVAQYLPADGGGFDLIVFDEASQIPVWDAIGVIARGRQLIVVGDPKQMPPTNFFQKGDSESDARDEDDIEDLESILDECIAAGLHSTYLSWHYRSRHESLIAFSNHYYYEDRLFTFPAATTTERLGVRFHFVKDGVYGRKGNRTNEREAESVVSYIFQKLEQGGKKSRSVGVVTFSQAQQELIEDLIERERPKHPALDGYFSDQNEEPLFVKNLENVQGDERDVILFSIGYGPDEAGRLSMNFGPLNRDGGERRLNVAITRAREQVVVFSSIHGEQIDLNRTQAVGAAHLKHFLNYAEYGTTFGGKDKSADADGQGDLADVVAGFLEGRGYGIARNVGSSDCRIELAVKDPKNPEEYVLGIACDGLEYTAQRTARDRDSLRTSVLKMLGWRLFHVWTVDWMYARGHAQQELLAAVEKACASQEVEPQEPVEEQRPEPMEVLGQPAAPVNAGMAGTTVTTVTTVTTATTVTTGAGVATGTPAPEMASLAVEMPTPEPPPIPEACPQNRATYVRWEPSGAQDQAMFYEGRGYIVVRRQMEAVLKLEGPILETLLKQRVARAWGFTRIGPKIQAVLDECLPRSGTVTRHGDVRVFWPADKTPETFKQYRVGNSEATRRSIDEIPPEELSNAMLEVMQDFQACERDTLYRETLKLFGMSALTAKARIYLDVALALLQASGKL